MPGRRARWRRRGSNRRRSAWRSLSLQPRMEPKRARCLAWQQVDGASMARVIPDSGWRWMERRAQRDAQTPANQGIAVPDRERLGEPHWALQAGGRRFDPGTLHQTCSLRTAAETKRRFSSRATTRGATTVLPHAAQKWARVVSLPPPRPSTAARARFRSGRCPREPSRSSPRRRAGPPVRPGPRC